MAKVYKTTFQLRRGKKDVWLKNNPILASAEPGYELDTGRLKIGDGITAWKDLEYFSGSVINVTSQEALPMPGSLNAIYKTDDGKIFLWSPSGYIQISGAGTVPNATSESPGVLKLYDVLGNNEDGTVTQKVITESLGKKVAAALSPEEELLIFTF